MFIEHDLGLWVWKAYGRRFADRTKKKEKPDRGVFRQSRSDDAQARRYLDDRDIFNIPA